MVLGFNLSSQQLERLAIATEPANQSWSADEVLSNAEIIVWQNHQSYLYLEWGGQLSRGGAGNNWAVDGVEALDGDESRVAWLTESGQVELFDWTQRRLVPNVDQPEAYGLFLGQDLVYLFSWEFTEVVDEELGFSHPTGRLDAYSLSTGQLVGQTSVLTQPGAVAELDGYSFWLVGEEIYIVDNQSISAKTNWWFNRPLADLIRGTDAGGRPVIYVLTRAGEIWDFQAERQTYNLVGRIPSGVTGQAVDNSLIQVENELYFGFGQLESPASWRTFKVQLGGN